MSTEALNDYKLFQKLFPKYLSPTESSTLCGLCTLALKGYKYARGQKVLAEFLGVGLDAVTPRLKRVEAKGLIVKASESVFSPHRGSNQEWLIDFSNFLDKGGRPDLALEDERGVSEPSKGGVQEIKGGRPQGERGVSAPCHKSKLLTKEENEHSYIIEVKKEINKTDPVLLPFCEDPKIIAIFDRLEKVYSVDPSVDPVECLAWLIRRQYFSRQPEYGLVFRFRDYLLAQVDVSADNLRDFAKWQKWQESEAQRVRDLDEALNTPANPNTIQAITNQMARDSKDNARAMSRDVALIPNRTSGK